MDFVDLEFSIIIIIILVLLIVHPVAIVHLSNQYYLIVNCT